MTGPVYQVGSSHNKVADSNQPIKIALVFSKSDWSISNVSSLMYSCLVDPSVNLTG